MLHQVRNDSSINRTTKRKLVRLTLQTYRLKTLLYTHTYTRSAYISSIHGNFAIKQKLAEGIDCSGRGTRTKLSEHRWQRSTFSALPSPAIYPHHRLPPSTLCYVLLHHPSSPSLLFFFYLHFFNISLSLSLPLFRS